MEHIIEHQSERIRRLADEIQDDITNIIEHGYSPSNQWNEHLMELKIIANILSDQDV